MIWLCAVPDIPPVPEVVNLITSSVRALPPSTAKCYRRSEWEIVPPVATARRAGGLGGVSEVVDTVRVDGLPQSGAGDSVVTPSSSTLSVSPAATVLPAAIVQISTVLGADAAAADLGTPLGVGDDGVDDRQRAPSRVAPSGRVIVIWLCAVPGHPPSRGGVECDHVVRPPSRRCRWRSCCRPSGSRWNPWWRRRRRSRLWWWCPIVVDTVRVAVLPAGAGDRSVTPSSSIVSWSLGPVGLAGGDRADLDGAGC